MTDTARKDDDGKARYSLIPADALREVAKIYTDGANKYGERNWEKGMKHCRVYDALQRHAQAWLEGQDHDQDSNGSHQLHMASVAWCALTLISYYLRSVGEDDRSDKHNNDPHPFKGSVRNILNELSRDIDYSKESAYSASPFNYGAAEYGPPVEGKKKGKSKGDQP